MKSDKIESGRYVNSYGPWVSIYWNEVEQDIAGNRTKVRLRFYFEWDRNINYVFRNRGGALYGSSFNYSGTARQTSGYGYLTLREQYVWVSHDSNGTKSVTFSGTIDSLGLSWSGTPIGSMSVSGTVRLTDIPRKHTLSGASMGANIKPSTGNTLTVTGSAPYTGHYYWAGIYDGSTNIYTYKVGSREYHTGNPIGTYTIDASVINVMLNRMRNVTSKTFRFRLWTYSGNGTGNLGESWADFNVTIDSSVKPSISGLSASIWGDRRDKAIDRYVQNYSYVEAKFSSSGGYGSTISSNYITVRHDETEGDSQTINGNSGATNGVVTKSGVYEVIATAIDGRGRSNTARTTLTVQAYSPPYISSFTAERNGKIGIIADGDDEENTKVQVNSSGGWSNLGGLNNLTVNTQRRIAGGTYTNAKANTTEKGGTFSNSFPTTENDISSSYEYRLYISDTFGNFSEAVVSIGTSKVLFDKHKDLGIGIGKLHERGALDVGGEAYFNGNLYVNDVNISNAESFSRYITVSGLIPDDSIRFWQSLPQGKYFVRPNDFPNQPASWGIIDHSTLNGDFNTIWYTQSSGPIYRKSGNHSYNFEWKQISNEIIGNKLWSGAVWLNIDHTVRPTKALSQCNNGWILEWSGYGSGTVLENSRTYTFIPKMQGNMPGNGGMYQIIGVADGSIKPRYLYCKDTYFSGYAENSADRIVLRSVYEW